MAAAVEVKESDLTNAFGSAVGIGKSDFAYVAGSASKIALALQTKVISPHLGVELPSEAPAKPLALASIPAPSLASAIGGIHQVAQALTATEVAIPTLEYAGSRIATAPAALAGISAAVGGLLAGLSAPVQVAFDNWTTWLAGVLYPASSGPAYAVNAPALQNKVVSPTTISAPASQAKPSTLAPAAASNANLGVELPSTSSVGVPGSQVAPTPIAYVAPAPVADLSGYVTQDALAAQLNQLSNGLKQLIYANAGTVQGVTPQVGNYSSGGTTNNIALASIINNLSNVTINNATFTGSVTGLPPSGATDFSGLSGLLAANQGGTGTTTAPAYGQLLLGDGNGGYNLVSTSSLGITTGSPALSGLTDVAIATPAFGDLLSYNGTKWANVSTSSLGITTGSSLPYYASTTIGNGTAAGGLTINGNATTTSLYIPGTTSGSGMLTLAGVNGSSIFNQEISSQVRRQQRDAAL